MASDRFTIYPTEGSGNGSVQVTPVGRNSGTTDINSTVTISNGVHNKTVSVVHWGMPSVVKTSGSSPVPYSGGVFTYDVTTHYPFRLHNLVLGPYAIYNQWGNQLFADRWYPVESAGTLTVSAFPNTVATGQGYDIRLQFDTQPTYYDVPIGYYIEPIPTDTPYINLNPETLMIDWNDTNSKMIQVINNIYELYGEYPTLWVQYDNPTDFWVAPFGSYSINLNANSANTGTTPKTTTIWVSAGTQDNPAMLTASASVYQAFTVLLSVSVDPTTIPQAGGVVSATVTSNETWWFNTQVGNWSGLIVDAATGDRVYPLAHIPPVTNAVYYFYTNANNTDSNMSYRVNLYASGATATTYSSYVTQDCVHINYEYTGTSNFGSGTYSETGEECILTVTANTSFSIDNSDVPWVSVSPTTGASGTTVFTIRAVSANTGDFRQGALIFKVAGNNITSFYVSQDGFVSMTIDPDYDEFTWEMQSGFVDVYCGDETQQWYADTADSWIELYDDGVQTGSVMSFQYNIIEDNTTGYDRLGVIEFWSYPIVGEGPLATLNICQFAEEVEPIEPFITVSPTGLTVGSGESNYNYFSVSASTNWVLDSKPAWTAFRTGSSYPGTALTGGTSGNTGVYCAVSGNSGSSRSGNAVFQLQGESPYATIAISQAATAPTPPPTPTWKATPSAFYALEPTASDTLRTTITALDTWTAEATYDNPGQSGWIHSLGGWSGYQGETELTFYVSANNSGGPREGAISIISNNVEVLHIPVEQDEP